MLCRGLLTNRRLILTALSVLVLFALAGWGCGPGRREAAADAGDARSVDGGGDGQRLPTFLPPSSYVAGMGPISVALGDLDRNGSVDVAVANSSSRDVSVFLNKGDGSLGAMASYPVGAPGLMDPNHDSPISLASADVNGDGQADLVTANYGGLGVNVLLNDGTGAFVTGGNYFAGSGPTFVALGDLNGDDRADVVLSCPQLRTGIGDVNVLMNDGAGAFPTFVKYAVGREPSAVAVGDLNGDGKLDVVSANAAGDVSVLLDGQAGNLSTSGTYATAASGGQTGVAAGDLDGDGKPDLAVVNSVVDRFVSVLLNNGDGTYAPAVKYVTGPSGVTPYSVAIGDLNGDGRADLAVGVWIENATANVSVLVNGGGAIFGAPVAIAAGMGPSSVAIGDLNADGKLDLVVANTPSGDVSVVLNACP